MEPLDPRLQEASVQPQASPYAYPPDPAASAAPAPYTLNPAHQQEVSTPQQSRNNALPLQHAPPGLPYYNIQQDTRQQTVHTPGTDPLLQSAAGLSPGMGAFGEDTPKRPRACEACRGLKVRCDFETDHSEVCKRCAKANRECLVTAPNRRRPKKTDTRVADLEKRIDDLTATLEEQRRQGGKRQAESEFEDNLFYNGHATELQNEPARKKQKSSYGNDSVSGFTFGNGFPLDHALQGNEYADVIDRGILSAEAAGKIFEHYTKDMAKNLPAVVFDNSVNVGILRKSKPILFLSVLSIASGQDYPDIQRTLMREAKKALADRVICKGEKSLELIQAIQVLSIWHVTEEQDDTMAYQLIQMASSMAVAMELGGPPLKGLLGMSFVLATRNFTLVADDTNSVEKRRSWLSCYILSRSNTIPIGQTNLVKRSAFLDSSIQVLENSPEAAPTDKVLCKWAKLQHLMDQASELSHSPTDSNQQAMREKMQDISGQMREFASGVDVSQSYSLKLAAHEVDSYCRLIATKIEELIDGHVTAQIAGQALKKPEEQYKVLTESYATAIKGCAESIHQLLDAFLSFLESASKTDLNSLPGFHYARITYSMVALICMSLGASAPESKVREVLDPNDLRVSHYLPRLLDLLRSSGADEIKRPAQKFQLVVKMLKAWYERTKDGRTDPIRNEILEMLDVQGQPSDDEGYQKLSVHGSGKAEGKVKGGKGLKVNGNTPLDLLSEVATKAPEAQAAQVQEWYHNQYQPYQQPFNPAVAQTADTPGQEQGVGVVFDPVIEQAMSMAFGSEGNMFGVFMEDFGAVVGLNDTTGVQNGGWFPGASA